jgi:putative ABC transport system substrate-binding protein
MPRALLLLTALLAAALLPAADAHPAVVLALGTRATLLAQKHVPGRPIVFTAVTNPVQSAVVKSWTGSGTNCAGNSNWLPARQLLKSFLLAVHGMRTLGVIRDPANPVSKAEVLEITRAIESEYRGITLRVIDVKTPEAVTAAAATLRDAGVDAVWVPIDHLVYRNLAPAAKLLDAAGVPVVTSSATAARSAAVVGVIPDYRVLGLQAADLARRIVQEGADPGTIPVGRLRTFRTVVNLKAAARCRYRIPLAVLAVADEVIR